MKNKNSLILLLAGIATTLAIIFSGCSTEDPWSPNPSNELILSFVSGPAADTVAYGSNVSFSWTSTGGVGEVLYRYRLDGGAWSTASNVTSVNLPNRTAGAVFDVEASDGGTQTVTVSREFFVGSAQGADTTPPSVWIDSAPVESSFVATGSDITFTWDGDDPGGAGDNLLFWWSFGGVDSDTSTDRSVTFDNVAAANPAEFTVTAWDQGTHPVAWWLGGVEYDTLVANPDSVISELNTAEASISFIVRDATILYIDDYQWLTVAGDVDMPKERDQKQFYRDALEGYAFAEWDIAVQSFPDSADLVTAGTPIYTTIVFASDTDIGSQDWTWWYDVGEPAAGPLHYYMEQGGNLIAAGAGILPAIWNSGNPPSPGDFEFDWLGVDSVESSVIDVADSTWWLRDTAYTEVILLPDSITVEVTYFDAWESEWWFTWAIKDANTMLNLPDSMKLDVAKNGDQDDYATGVWSLRNEVGVARTEVLFRWGLWVDGDPPGRAYYQSPVGHITSLNSGQQYTVMLNFDIYSMPLSAVKQTFQAILPYTEHEPGYPDLFSDSPLSY